MVCLRFLSALVLVAAAAFCYWPGLSGPFLLDDQTNLAPLALAHGDLSLDHLRTYLASGWTGPTGRPISLASFYLNAQDWPTDPWKFKFTNLCLHLANGLLVLGLAGGAMRLTGRTAALSWWAGLAAAAVWLLHPIQVSTVLYVTQRMAVLAAMFTLLGLGGYVAGRALARKQAWRGMLVMTVGLGLGTVLATLSKENGVLLPLYALVLELTLLARVEAPVDRGWRWCRAVILGAPCAVLVAYSAWKWNDFVGSYGVHDFDVGERLLTQPRVLFDYMQMVVAPWTVDARLFHEEFPISTGLFAPPATVLAVAGLAALLFGALYLRRRMPVLAFGVLWFLAGHVLESSFIGLEMYYEHRNYLPLLGPAVAFAWITTNTIKGLKRERLRFLRFLPGKRGLPPIFICLVFVLGAAGFTEKAAVAWGDSGTLSRYWADQAPGSWRVQQFVAQHWLAVKKPRRARKALREAVRRNPDHIGVALQLTVVECLLGAKPSLDRQSLLRRARIGGYDSSVYTSLDALLQTVGNQRCSFPGLGELLAVERLLIANPHYTWAPQQARLRFDLALALVLGGRLTDGVQAGARAIQWGAKENVAGALAELFRRSGQSAKVLAYIDQARAAEPAEKKGYRRAIGKIERAILSGRQPEVNGAG